MAYTYKRSGAYVGGRRYKSRRVSKRGSRYGRKRMSVTRRAARPKYLFHRWVSPALPIWSSTLQASGLNWTSAQAAYSATSGILGANVNQTEIDASATFALSDLYNVQEFSTLFDQYKINAVLFSIKMINVPECTDAANTNLANYGNFYPTIWYAPDHDDSNVLTVQQLKEYEKVKHKVLRPNKEINILLKPTPLFQMYNTTATTGYACNFKRQWLDMSQTTIPHFGLKFCIDFEGLSVATGQIQGFQFKIQAKYYLQCKNVR